MSKYLFTLVVVTIYCKNTDGLIRSYEKVHYNNVVHIQYLLVIFHFVKNVEATTKVNNSNYQINSFQKF